MKEKKCFHCQFYYITFDKTSPHGCKAFQFKSATLPALVVAKNSHQDCHAWKKKNNVQTKLSSNQQNPDVVVELKSKLKP
jgi:hypothetical protein